MVDDAVHVLTRAGVPATARRRLGLREVPAIRAVLAVLGGAVDGWDRHGLVEVAEQPYFASGLDAGILNWLGHREAVRGLSAWSERLEEWAARSRADEEREARGEEAPELQKRLPASARLTAAAEGVRHFAGQGGFPTGDRPVLEWVRWLEELLREDPWEIEANARRPIPDEWDALRLDLAALRAFAKMLAEWRGALERWGGEALPPVSLEYFVRELAAEADQDLAIWTPVQVGVQVLEAFAAAYRSFDHLFLVGLEAGRFPKRAPVSPLFDEADRAALRLEQRQDWEQRERELFRVLVAGSTEVTLCWSRTDESGSEQLRSSLVEVVDDVATLNVEAISAGRVRSPAFPLALDAAASLEGLRLATIERSRSSGALSPWNGRIEDPALVSWLEVAFGDDRQWSPSQLESYAKCPWSYFATRLLKIEKLEDPDDSLDPAVRGTILHKSLEIFFDRAKARQRGPVHLRNADLAWVESFAHEALDGALAAQTEAWVGHPAFKGARRTELWKILWGYLQWEVAENEASYKLKKDGTVQANLTAPKRLRVGAERHEFTFTDVRLVRNGVTVRYRGSIDRLDRGCDERIAGSERFLVAIDYKTSKSAVPGKGAGDPWSEKIVLQLPLYAHALEAKHMGVLARLEYRSLKSPSSLLPLAFVRVEPNTKVLEVMDQGRELLDAALDDVVGHVRAIRSGSFPAAPAPSQGCPPYCAALEICRVAGGPQLGWTP